jgi:hypothetical protein
MRHLLLLVAFASASAVAAGFALASAQESGEMTRFVIISSKTRALAAAPAARPYQPVVIKLPTAPEEPDFESFRSELAGVAKARVYVELARLVAVQGFFWDRDFAGGFDRRRASVDNLAIALRLEHRNGMGWETLAKFAAEPTAAVLTGRPGVLCAPGEASYDDVEFDRVIDATRSAASDWGYPRAEKTAVRSAPQAGAAVIDRLGQALVRVLDFQGNDKGPDIWRTGWARVATAAGKIGFVAPGTLTSLSPERLCYGRDGFGRWRIAGFVAAE